MEYRVPSYRWLLRAELHGVIAPEDNNFNAHVLQNLISLMFFFSFQSVTIKNVNFWLKIKCNLTIWWQKLFCEVREKTNKMQQLDVYYQYFLNMFRASLCPSAGEQDVCYCTWCAALVLLDVVGSGCGALHCRVQRSAPQPLPTTSSRISAAHHVK